MSTESEDGLLREIDLLLGPNPVGLDQWIVDVQSALNRCRDSLRRAAPVPREPTEAMIDQGARYLWPRERVAKVWQVMYDAALQSVDSESKGK